MAFPSPMSKHWNNRIPICRRWLNGGLKYFLLRFFETASFTQICIRAIFLYPNRILKKPQYIAIDCAIIGSLSESDQYYMARNLLAIFQRDYRLVAELHIECGWIPAETHVHEFESVMRSVCEPIFEKPLAEISFGQLLISLFETARRFEMEAAAITRIAAKNTAQHRGFGSRAISATKSLGYCTTLFRKVDKRPLCPQRSLQTIT